MKQFYGLWKQDKTTGVLLWKWKRRKIKKAK